MVSKTDNKDAKSQLEDTLKRNPHIDPELLEKSRQLLEELRQRGVKAAGYRLVSPHDQATETSKEIDPRTVHVG